jgi:hypothetical protein
MLRFPTAAEIVPPEWVPQDVGGWTALQWDIQTAFTSAETLVDDIVGDKGVYDDVIASLKEDPDGPQIDVEQDLVACLDGRITVINGHVEPLGTDADKPFLEDAPWLIVAFQLTKCDDGGQVYYLKESVGLACGFLLAAAHHAGLATLTHTPSPMAFLNDILGRPAHERPFLLIPVGYAADDCVVPKAAVARRPLDEVMVVI